MPASEPAFCESENDRPKVLVIEDYREYQKEAEKLQGCEVAVGGTLAEAIERIESFFDYCKNEREEQLRIGKEIKTENGVIPYLRVDDSKVREWRRQFDSESTNGVRLFTELLRREHRARELNKVMSR